MTIAAFPASGWMPYALRLHPGDDLKESLQTCVHALNLSAACIVTAVGSLAQANLRYAGRDSATRQIGRFEIVSLVGTLSPEGVHLHLAIADENGTTFGGHLMPGCLIYTTAEIAIVAFPGLSFHRQPDPATGYAELVITPTSL